MVSAPIIKKRPGNLVTKVQFKDENIECPSSLPKHCPANSLSSIFDSIEKTKKLTNPYLNQDSIKKSENKSINNPLFFTFNNIDINNMDKTPESNQIIPMHKNKSEQPVMPFMGFLNLG